MEGIEGRREEGGGRRGSFYCTGILMLTGGRGEYLSCFIQLDKVRIRINSIC